MVATTREVLRSAERAASEATKARDEAVRMELRAGALATLEAWGRAFDVLAPAKSEIAQAPAFALGFAELAWRAGEFGVARQLLANLLPPDAVERTTRTWSQKMGWLDVPGGQREDPLPL
jgi:hypothetical protein